MAIGKYNEWSSGDNLLRIQGWARDGLTDEQIANNIGIDRATYYRWLKREEQNGNCTIRDTIKQAREVDDVIVENALFEQAKKGNTAAIIFWLKNRKPKKWKDIVKDEDSSNLANEKLDSILGELRKDANDVEEEEV